MRVDSPAARRIAAILPSPDLSVTPLPEGEGLGVRVAAHAGRLTGSEEDGGDHALTPACRSPLSLRERGRG